MPHLHPINLRLEPNIVIKDTLREQNHTISPPVENVKLAKP